MCIHVHVNVCTVDVHVLYAPFLRCRRRFRRHLHVDQHNALYAIVCVALLTCTVCQRRCDVIGQSLVLLSVAQFLLLGVVSSN